MKKIILSLVILLSISTHVNAQQNWWDWWWNWNNNGNNGNANGNQGNGNGNGNNGNGNGNGGSNNGGNTGGGTTEAEESTGANQSTNLSLSNAIEITFTQNASIIGGSVSLAFTNVNHYANGVESEEQELMVRSNKNFSIGVKSNVTNFTYTGTTTPAPVMPVNGVLGLKVTENNTGGSIASPFSSANYASLTSSNQNLITGSSRGGNKTFSIQYKATPGFAYPAGTYSADVVYTATQQ